MNIWQTLYKKAQAEKRPVLVLAPMANVTDAAFRAVISKYGKPDALWTEFVSADGLRLAHEEGKQKLLRDLLYIEQERPIIAQFFSSNIESMYQAGRLVVKLGFDGADINMGCPDKSIEKQKAGAAMMRDPKHARLIITALQKGIEDEAKESGKAIIPVSVKTRIGFNKNELETWLPALLGFDQNAEGKFDIADLSYIPPVLITIHARTRKEMSKVPARWVHVARAVEIRNELQKNIVEENRTLIFGNGDVIDIVDAKQKAQQTHADGVMLGRAIFGNPWLFNADTVANPPTLSQKLIAMKEHINLFDSYLGDIKSFAIMKKHFKSYVLGFDGAKDLRLKLMEVENKEEAIHIIDSFLNQV